MKILYFILLLWSGLLAFEVVDEGAVIHLKPGTAKIKYVSVYNFEVASETLQVKLILDKYPKLRKPGYQFGLAKIDQEQLQIRPGEKKLFPVYLEAGKRLTKGRYYYWLEFASLLGKNISEDLVEENYKTFRLPLIIEIN